MDVTGHLRASLDAAIALADHVGSAYRQGRPRAGAADAEGVRAALGAAEVDAASLAVLRDAGARLYAALGYLVDGRVDDAAREVNGLLSDTGARPSLVRHDGAPWHLHFAAPGAVGAGRWAADLACAVAMLVGSDDIRRLRRCGADRCDDVFLDTTRNGTRRFCSPGCQNRAKVAAFRARGSGR